MADSATLRDVRSFVSSLGLGDSAAAATSASALSKRASKKLGDSAGKKRARAHDESDAPVPPARADSRKPAGAGAARDAGPKPKAQRDTSAKPAPKAPTGKSGKPPGNPAGPPASKPANGDAVARPRPLPVSHRCSHTRAVCGYRRRIYVCSRCRRRRI
jgi:hypothetical protein